MTERKELREAKRTWEQDRFLLVEANQWIQQKVAQEGGLVGCRKGKLCLACRLRAHLRQAPQPAPEGT